MDEEKLRAFEDQIDNDAHRDKELFKKIGSIVLIPEASLDDHVLAAVSVLERLADGPIDRGILEYATAGVAKYGLWGRDINNRPRFEYSHDAQHVRRQFFSSFDDLVAQGLINQDTSTNPGSSRKITITDAGKVALRNVTPEEDTGAEETPLSNIKVRRIASSRTTSIFRDGKRITTTTSEIPDQELYDNFQRVIAMIREGRTDSPEFRDALDSLKEF